MINDLIHRSKAVYVTEVGNEQVIYHQVSTVPDHVLDVAGLQHLFNRKGRGEPNGTDFGLQLIFFNLLL